MFKGKQMIKNAFFRTVTLTAALALSAGCSMTPDYQRPAVPAAAGFSGTPAAGAIEADAIARDWWKSFGSAELDGLMARALENNTDIRAAVARIEQARGQLRIAGADLVPSVDAVANASRQRSNPARGSTDYATDLSVGLGVAYEVDLFGRNRAGADAARANLRATEFDREAINLLTMGEVARTYFTLVNGYERLAIADQTIRNSGELLDIVEARLEAGAASRLEVAQQRAQLASTKAQRATLERGIANAENALAVLLGEAAQTVKVKARALSGLKIPAIAPGQPSRLLERRPDIQSAEQDLIAANANIGVARAAFFPTLNLGLDAGLARAGLGDPTSSILSLAAGLAMPIFQGGRLEGGLQQATGIQKELAESYRKAVLVAFQETEDALAAVRAAESSEKSLAVAARESTDAYRISRELFDAGSTDFQTILDVQRSELSARDAHTQSRAERLTAAVDLYLALGGGWSKP